MLLFYVIKGKYVDWLGFSAAGQDALLDASQDQCLKKIAEVPAPDVAKLISQEQKMRVLVKFDSSDRERLDVLGHGLGDILFLHDDFVLELAVSSGIEGGKSVDIDAEQALKRVKEEHVLHLHIVFLRQDLVSVAHEISDDGVAIVASGCQDLASLLYCHSVAPFLVLLHHVSHRALCVLRRVLVVDEHFCPHRHRDDPS